MHVVKIHYLERSLFYMVLSVSFKCSYWSCRGGWKLRVMFYPFENNPQCTTNNPQFAANSAWFVHSPFYFRISGTSTYKTSSMSWTGDADLRFYITTVQDGWHRSAFLTWGCFPCTIHLIMQYIEPVSEWSCWRMFIETWPHSELTFRHRASSI